MKKVIVLASAAFVLAGCSTWGTVSYEVMPVALNGGVVCSFKAIDGKEFEERSLMFSGGDCQLAIGEKKAKAFKGQALMVKAINILPTMGLGDILAPRDQ